LELDAQAVRAHLLSPPFSQPGLFGEEDVMPLNAFAIQPPSRAKGTTIQELKLAKKNWKPR
jgi:hypothetical protein